MDLHIPYSYLKTFWSPLFQDNKGRTCKTNIPGLETYLYLRKTMFCYLQQLSAHCLVLMDAVILSMLKYGNKL